MIVEMAAVLTVSAAEASIRGLLNLVATKPERINTPEKKENLEKVQEGYAVLVEVLRQKKQDLKDLL